MGLALLGAALVFNAVLLPSEARVSALPFNDDVFHSVASQRLGESVAFGEPFLDPWVAEWGLGFPVWRSYQPLPHLVAAPFVTFAPPGRKTAVFAMVATTVRGLLPAAVWAGSRLFGLSPLASGLAALLSLTPSATGDLGRFGLGMGASTWRGSGLYTQQFALLFLPLAIGFTRRSLDSGRHTFTSAAWLALTLLSHIVFGYAGALAAVVLALVGPAGERARRLARLAWIAGGSILLTSWFTIPLLISRAHINHSKWEPWWKWDSFGSRTVLSALFDGSLLDQGRLPVLTVLVGLGVAGALVLWRADVGRRLLVLALVLFALFLGRDTWGHLLLLLGVPHDLHLHRTQAAFELSACLLAAWFVDAALVGLRKVGTGAVILAALFVGGGIGAALSDRAIFLTKNAEMGAASQATFAREEADIRAAMADVRRLLQERPGRMTAGPAAGWGGTFKAGEIKAYDAAALEHLDSISFLSHAMSRAGDMIFDRGMEDPAHDELFAIRAVVAPLGHPVPPHYREVGRHGRFVVYETSREGYFGLGDLLGRYTGPKGTESELSTAWLAAPASRAGHFVSLGGGPPALPAVGRWQPLPPAPDGASKPRGAILSVSAGPGRWCANVRLTRACWVVLKTTFFPDLQVSVDGIRVPSIDVTPGFPAAPVPAGEHVVEVVYRPSPLKPLLFVFGLAGFAFAVAASRSGRLEQTERRLTELAARLERAAVNRIPLPAVAVGALLLLSCRALFRGLLGNGHDSLTYVPRIVEFLKAILDGHVPPFWAPDLGAGFGQPEFGFSPPLTYLAALPFQLAGLHLADCLQLGLLALVAAGTWAVYRLSRELPVSRTAAVGAAAFWLFSPYLHTDLFVRYAMAESAAMAVAPLAVLLCWRLVAAPTGPAALAAAAAAVALVVLGHNCVSLLVVPFLAALPLASLALGKRPVETAPALRVGLALAFGLALSAFFWVPALTEGGFVKTDKLLNLVSWRDHFPTFGQLLYSPWGFGLSIKGPGDGMSFMVGPLHLLAGGLGLWSALRRGRGPARALGVVAATASAAGIFLASPASTFLWERVQLLQYFGLPWRALVLPTIFLPLLAALALDELRPRWAFAAIAAVVLLNVSHTEPKGYLRFDDEFYEPAGIASRAIETLTFREFEPRGVVGRPSPRSLPLVFPGGLEFLERSEKTARRDYLVRLERGGQVEASTFWYPGWRVRVDGGDVDVVAVPVSGTISFFVPAGTHRVVLSFELTPARARALLVSVTSAVLLLAVLLAGAFLRWRKSDGLAAVLARPVIPLLGAAVVLAILLILALLVLGSTREAARAASRERAASLLTVALDRDGRGDGLRLPQGSPPPAVAPLQVAPAVQNRVVASPEAQEVLMKAGLDLLYTKRDPVSATVPFRKVLEANPTHYGATYQLAEALERAGRRDEARPLWEKVLAMAQGYRDAETLETARKRLEQRP